MPELVRYEVVRNVAVITVDNPPVNALSPGVPEGIFEGVRRAATDTDALAVVLIGAGTTFIAGADIRIFETIASREISIERSRQIHARLRAIEDCPKPLVAAIHGTALGGGLEFAMACHYRVAIPSARVGQPEVLLGIIPGAGGTQRLPRLCGAAMAAEMCTAGNHVPASRALAEGILDDVVQGDLREGAIEFALTRVMGGGIRRVRDLAVRITDTNEASKAIESVRQSLAKTARGARAPYAALDAIEAGILQGFDRGSEKEIELFAECVTSTESRAMVTMFFAEREAAKIPGIAKDTPTAEIRTAAVVGAGTMGGGIAMSYANAGIPVLLREASQEALDRGLAVIRKNYESTVSKGRMTPEQYERTMSLIRPTLTYDGFDQVDIAVEAVFEDMDLKKSVFTELGRVTKPSCILASNTSTLDVDEFARASSRPDKVIGHHFFSPANVMKLLEIVRGAETSKEAIATSMKLARKLGKVGVVVGNCFGFVANRMLAYYLREANLLLEEGASVSQIDGVLARFGFPVGPFAMGDIAGLDVGWRVRQHLKKQGKTRAEGPQSVIPDQLYEMGRYGQKTGAGWYRYDAGSRTPIPDALIDQLAEQAAKARGITRHPVEDQEILDRILTALANEGARILEEGYAIRAGDIDIIYNYGFGFPRHRGGPMWHADQTGLKTVLARVNQYRARFGDYWTAAPLLEQLVAQGRTFYQGLSYDASA